MPRFSLAKSLSLLCILASCWAAAHAQSQPGKRPPVRRSRSDASRPPAATPPTVPAFCPLVELKALNSAYIQELARRRQLRQPLPPAQAPVRFDSLLLPGTVLHNQRLVVAPTGVLFHDIQQPHAELCGYRSDLMRYRGQPTQLAHAIWQQLDNSKKGHKEVQQDHQFAYVSVSCSDTYFVVRLDSHPTTPTKAEQKGYAHWQKQHLLVP